MELILDKKKRYLIAVSGGPDSMALLDMAFCSGSYIEAAHLNYHKRGSADRDEKIVSDYCEKRNIIFHRCDFDFEKYNGNFQAAARDARYDFFADVVKERKLDEVLVAHQKDDLIETYLMQKEKKLGVSYYGLKERNVINGVNVYRPLLKYNKRQLQEYCDEHDIPYGIDESNLSDDYVRNQIRHKKIERWDDEKKGRVIKEIAEKNRIRGKHIQRASSFLNRESYTVKGFLSIPYLKDYLSSQFLHKSKAFYEEMFRQIREADQCVFYGKDLMISKEYGRVYLSKIAEDYEYRFTDLSMMKDFECQYFRLCESGEKIEGVSFDDADFPITIRNYRDGDQIHMRYGHKKVNRFFIDRKILLKDRKKWPVMINQRSEVIFVSGIGCDLKHYSEIQDIFMIKL